MLLRIASVAVPAFLVFASHAACQAIYLDERRAGRLRSGAGPVSLVLQVAGTRRGRAPALAVVASALVLVAAAWDWGRHA